MNKRNSIITLVILGIIGSFVMFYATELFMYDVGLKFSEPTIISTLPGLMIAFDFILAIMYVLKLQAYGNSKRALTKLYSVVLASFAGVGLITSILTGVVLYKSFVTPYPFPGYTIICLIVNTLVLVFALVTRLALVKKLPEDTEEAKLSVKKVFKALGLGFVTFFTLDRVGALLWIGSYLQPRTLYMSWVFYVYTLVPLLTYIYLAIKYFGVKMAECKAYRVYAIVIACLQLVFGVATIVIGYANPLFVQAISMAMALERFAAMPVVILPMFLGYLSYYIVQLVKAIKHKPAK